MAFVLRGNAQFPQPILNQSGTNFSQLAFAPLGTDVLRNHAPIGGQCVVSDLFGLLLLLLIEKKPIQETTERNRGALSDPVVDDQTHAFCSFQSVRFCCVLFDCTDSETPSRAPSVRS